MSFQFLLYTFIHHSYHPHSELAPCASYLVISFLKRLPFRIESLSARDLLNIHLIKSSVGSDISFQYVSLCLRNSCFQFLN